MMDIFLKHKLIPSDDGYILVLYLNPDNTEFSYELSYFVSDKKERLTDTIEYYTKEKFPNLKINTVKVLMGSMLIASIPFSSNLVKIPQFNSGIKSEQKDYASYVVKYGDTLLSIARYFNITSDAIKMVNKLITDSIYVGQSLKIPVNNTSKISSINYKI